MTKEHTERAANLALVATIVQPGASWTRPAPIRARKRAGSFWIGGLDIVADFTRAGFRRFNTWAAAGFPRSAA